MLVRVNLGCGLKLMENAINVDIITLPEGQVLPDTVKYVQDDVRSLRKFDASSVDELMAFHLVEHIPVYDLEATLIRWNEVLKPGGVLVLEQPDIVKCMINSLQMLTTKDSKLHYNLGMCGIFGLPTPDNEYMEHKWGWTPESLTQYLRNAGFVNIEEQPPQTHAGPSRDFRLVARKREING